MSEEFEIPQDPERKRFRPGSSFDELGGSQKHPRVHLVLLDASASMSNHVLKVENGVVIDTETTRIQRAKHSVDKAINDHPHYLNIVRCFDEKLIDEPYNEVQEFGYTDIEKCLLEAVRMLQVSLKRSRMRRFMKLRVTVITDAEDDQFNGRAIHQKLRKLVEVFEGEPIFIGSGLSDDRDAWASVLDALNTEGVSILNGDPAEAMAVRQETEQNVEEINAQYEEVVEREQQIVDVAQNVVSQPEIVMEAVRVESAKRDESEAVLIRNSQNEQVVDQICANDDQDEEELIQLDDLIDDEPEWKKRGMKKSFYNFLKDKKTEESQRLDLSTYANDFAMMDPPILTLRDFVNMSTATRNSLSSSRSFQEKLKKRLKRDKKKWTKAQKRAHEESIEEGSARTDEKTQHVMRDPMLHFMSIFQQQNERQDANRRFLEQDIDDAPDMSGVVY